MLIAAEALNKVESNSVDETHDKAARRLLDLCKVRKVCILLTPIQHQHSLLDNTALSYTFILTKRFSLSFRLPISILPHFAFNLSFFKGEWWCLY
jgi:hypothetical protein